MNDSGCYKTSLAALPGFLIQIIARTPFSPCFNCTKQLHKNRVLRVQKLIFYSFVSSFRAIEPIYMRVAFEPGFLAPGILPVFFLKSFNSFRVIAFPIQKVLTYFINNTARSGYSLFTVFIEQFF